MSKTEQELHHERYIESLRVILKQYLIEPPPKPARKPYVHRRSIAVATVLGACIAWSAALQYTDDGILLSLASGVTTMGLLASINMWKHGFFN